MDSYVIAEIASQLGIAVENASQFIEDILPRYATVQVVGVVFADAMFILLSLVMLVIAAKFYKNWRKINEDRLRYRDDFTNFVDDHSLVCFSAGIVWAATFFVVLFGTPYGLGWAISPEAMLLDMVLHRIGGC